MIDLILAFVIGLAIGSGAGALAGVYVADNLKPRSQTQITYITQETMQETTQKTEVFQGQITIVITSANLTTNVNINVAGLTNFTFKTNFITNKAFTNSTNVSF